MFILGNITFSDFWRHCYQTFVFDVCVHAWFVYFRLTCFESVWICSRGNQSQERSQAVSVTMGMEYKKYIYTNSSFSLFVVLLNKLFVVVVLLNKQFIWKLWKHYCEWCHFCDQQSVSVMLQTRLECVKNKIIWEGHVWQGVRQVMSQPFLLFIGKEWSDMAASRGCQIWSRKVLLLDRCW